MTKEELKQEFEKYFEQKNNEGYLWVTQEMEQSELKDDCEMVCLDFAEPREKRIAELEHQLTHRNCLDCSNHSSKLRMKTLELEKECTKAKELLKSFIELENCTLDYDEIKEAEQFLNEVEK